MTFLETRWQLRKSLKERGTQLLTCALFLHPQAAHVTHPLLPIWKEEGRGGSLIKSWHSASRDEAYLYYPVLGKHLEKKQWPSPVMYVALSRWEVLNKSQQTPHKPWLLIYMFNTNWMCKSIRKLISWDFQAFMNNHYIKLTIIFMQIHGNIHYKIFIKMIVNAQLVCGALVLNERTINFSFSFATSYLNVFVLMLSETWYHIIYKLKTLIYRLSPVLSIKSIK